MLDLHLERRGLDLDVGVRDLGGITSSEGWVMTDGPMRATGTVRDGAIEIRVWRSAALISETESEIEPPTALNVLGWISGFHPHKPKSAKLLRAYGAPALSPDF